MGYVGPLVGTGGGGKEAKELDSITQGYPHKLYPDSLLD
jgi:hypothetical protein